MSEAARILCIEDEPALMEDLAEELRDAGYEVFEARNGHQGVEIARANRPDLILCDIMMPEMDGTQVLATVRRLPGSVSDTAFVFLTAKATRDDLIAGKKLGVDDYLTKPVDFDLLLATVETRLDQVKRIRKRSELEMIRVYKAMAPKAKRRVGAIRIGILTDTMAGVGVVKDGLAAMGCLVQRYASAQDFVSHMKRIDIDLLFVLQDGVFKRTTGDMLRATANKPTLPVFRLTPESMRNFATEILPDDGFDRTIGYPYRPADIFQAIMSTFESLGRPKERVAI